ncbi:MAG: hypothetical protein AMXMBFR13_41340 [Phycisphaerae bacterium]
MDCASRGRWVALGLVGFWWTMSDWKATAADRESPRQAIPRPAGLPGWVTLFDGETFKGWEQVGGARWTVEDGTIVGESGDGSFGWLVFQQPFADFLLEFECKHEAPGNSGIQFRSHVIDGKMYGYQAEFDPRPDHGTGGIYEQGGRGWLRKPDAKGLAAMKPMEWNRYRITAVAERLTLTVNDVQTVKIRDWRARSGILAFQVHSGKTPVKVRWRNIRIQDLGDGGGWTPLVRGESLEGWHTHGEKDVWRVVNKGPRPGPPPEYRGRETKSAEDRERETKRGDDRGKETTGLDGQEATAGAPAVEIVGELTKESPYAYLVTDRTFKDFELKLEMVFDSEQGNSGVFFRCSFPPQCTKCNEVARGLREDVQDFKCPKCGNTESLPYKERVHIHGPQVEFAPPGDHTGAVYDARVGKWVNLEAFTPLAEKLHRFHEWNDLRLKAIGDHVLVYLNGLLVTELKDYSLPDDGVIALQLHAGGPMRVRFRDLQIRPAEEKERDEYAPFGSKQESGGQE